MYPLRVPNLRRQLIVLRDEGTCHVGYEFGDAAVVFAERVGFAPCGGRGGEVGGGGRGERVGGS